ncbi:hypothetical protein [Sporichthya sp.]|uniref:hypothetical protein n=1 Tax=Sporichthya sp. TaxID=65475 RepID=UPI0017E34A71|nr:hypothetical protein [Sporichthya sp.]MBA3742085.1 hypothetical protein [Sporichthya sp.]
MTATAHPRRTSRVHVPGRRALTLITLIALPVVVAADLGSVALVKVSVEDDAGEAARAGVMAIQYGQTATPQTAEIAFRAAKEVADLHRLTIDPATFVVTADGSVRFAARRDAPTALFKHLPGLRDLTDTTVTVSAQRPNF